MYRAIDYSRIGFIALSYNDAMDECVIATFGHKKIGYSPSWISEL